MSSDTAVKGSASSAWVPNAKTTKVELLEMISALQRENMILTDRVRGQEAEIATLTARMKEISATELGIAFARVDSLEDQREVLIDELHRAIIRQRDERELIKKTSTWRVGSMIIRPLSAVASRVRRP